MHGHFEAGGHQQPLLSLLEGRVSVVSRCVQALQQTGVVKAAGTTSARWPACLPAQQQARAAAAPRQGWQRCCCQPLLLLPPPLCLLRHPAMHLLVPEEIPPTAQITPRQQTALRRACLPPAASQRCWRCWVQVTPPAAAAAACQASALQALGALRLPLSGCAGCLGRQEGRLQLCWGRRHSRSCRRLACSSLPGPPAGPAAPAAAPAAGQLRPPQAALTLPLLPLPRCWRLHRQVAGGTAPAAPLL